MNRIASISCASLMLICVCQGCEDAQEEPVIAPVTKAVEVQPEAAKLQNGPLPVRCPQEILDLLKSEDVKAKREAGKRLGDLLRQSRQTPLSNDKASPEDRAQLQLDVLNRIGELGPLGTNAVPALQEILKEEAPLKLKQQVLGLLQKGVADKRIGPALAFVCQDATLQAAAIQLIIQLGCDDSASVTALGKALQNRDLTMTSLAALRGLGDRAVMPAARFVMDVATSSQQPLATRLAAIEVVGKFSRTRVPGIERLCYDDDPAIRKASMRLGISSGDLLVREKDPEVIAAAFEGFARPPIDPKYLALVFEQALKKESLRGPVKQFLTEHPDKVVKTLLYLFKSDSAMIRDYSVDQFAELKNDEPVIAALKEIIQESSDPGLRTLAAIKLVEVPPDSNPKELAESVSKWIEQPKLKNQVLALLTKVGVDAIPILTQLATDSRLDSVLKAEILGILLKMPGVADIAEPLLQEIIESEDASTRHWAAVGLTRLASDETEEFESEVSPVLQEALKSSDLHLLRTTLEALRDNPKVGAGIAGDILTQITHADPSVRIPAIQALVAIAPLAKMPAIQDALKKAAAEDSDAGVKKVASEAVRQLEKVDK